MLPNRCHRGLQSLKNTVISGFSGSLKSFPLYCGRGFGRDIVDDAVDALDLIDDAGRDSVQYVVGDSGPVGGHEVAGGDGTEGQGIVIGPAVAHDTHRPGVGEDGKILVDGGTQAGSGDLLPVNGIGVPQAVQLVLGQVSDDPDGQAGTGEGLTHH